MPYDPVNIPFGPKPSPRPFYEFLRATVDEATIQMIATADWGEGAVAVWEMLVTTLETGDLPPEDDENLAQLLECLSLVTNSSFSTSIFPLFLRFDLESEAMESTFCDHNHELAQLVSLALEHSHEAASALAPYMSWLAQNDHSEWPRSFHVLALLLLLVSIRPEEIGPTQVAFLEQLFDDELRANASSVTGNKYCGYEDALGMIADGECIWLLCLDAYNCDHGPWIRLVDRVLEGHDDTPELKRLRSRLCPQ